MVQHPFRACGRPRRGGRESSAVPPAHTVVDLAEVVVQRPLVVAGHETAEQDRYRPPGTWRSDGPFHAGRPGQGNYRAGGNDVSVGRAARL